ncbi:MAG: tetratricopeptide repeat protein [Chloroflexota bacterium]
MRATRKETFGELLRGHRKAVGCTQEELAERASLSFRAISDLERGAKLRPHSHTVYMLALALGLTDEQRTEFEQAARQARQTLTPAPPVAALAHVSHSGVSARPLARHNLPVPTTSFIGRKNDLMDVRGLVLQVGARLVTLAGPGGSGKTRLALEVAASLLDDFSYGVHFVNLAPITDPNYVIPEIAQVLGCKEVEGQLLYDVLKDFLREKHILLTLDNFEQVASAAPLLMDLLVKAPGLKLLVTSREVLHLSGEHVFLVPPLSLPDLKALPSLEMLPSYEAVALFVQRAAAARAGFALTADNAATIAEICTHLDGLPLAIELAASRVRLFSPNAMLGRLRGRLAWLTGGPRDQTNRQQTLRGTLDWSYNLLDAFQQEVFARLAVFTGGCTLEAAEAVTGANFDSIGSLVDKSLLQERVGGDGETRFHMLETIREYALERLTESRQDTAIRNLHSVYLAELAAKAEAMLPTAARGSWIARLDTETENMRASLTWCLEGQGDRETGLTLAGALFWYWRRSNPAEGRRWLQNAVTEIVQGTAAYSSPNPGLLGWCKAGAAFLAWVHSDREVARAGLQEAIDLLRHSQDRLKLAHALGWLGMAESYLQHYSAARMVLDEALAIFEDLGQEWDRAMGLQYSGIAESQAWLTGVSPEIASRHLEESNKIFLALGDDWARSATLNSLAWLTAESHNYAHALTLTKEGLELAQLEGSPQVTAEALQSMAMLMHIYGGDYEGEVPVLHEALSAWRKLGNRRAEATILQLLGFCMMALGELEQARTLCEESLALFRQLGDDVEDWWAMRDLASVYRLLGEHATALDLYESALHKFRGEDPRWFHLVCLRDLVALLGPSSQPEIAATLLGAADALEESITYYWSSDNEINFDRRLKAETVEAARATLDAEAFSAAWSAGRAIPGPRALECAIMAVHTRLSSECRVHTAGTL